MVVVVVVVKEWSQVGSQKTPDAVVGVATEEAVRPAKGSEGVDRLSSLPGEASLFQAMAYRTPIAMLLLAWMVVVAIVVVGAAAVAVEAIVGAEPGR